ncbi:hypothetical protein S40288_10787 [Stachybotrys chartarum IBT 40288]|nr:hypothetical protein S40288_10787 [Stachybotrys chartarum IBT 40288]
MSAKRPAELDDTDDSGRSAKAARSDLEPIPQDALVVLEGPDAFDNPETGLCLEGAELLSPSRGQGTVYVYPGSIGDSIPGSIYTVLPSSKGHGKRETCELSAPLIEQVIVIRNQVVQQESITIVAIPIAATKAVAFSEESQRIVMFRWTNPGSKHAGPDKPVPEARTRGTEMLSLLDIAVNSILSPSKKRVLYADLDCNNQVTHARYLAWDKMPSLSSFPSPSPPFIDRGQYYGLALLDIVLMGEAINASIGIVYLLPTGFLWHSPTRVHYRATERGSSVWLHLHRDFSVSTMTSLGLPGGLVSIVAMSVSFDYGQPSCLSLWVERSEAYPAVAAKIQELAAGQGFILSKDLISWHDFMNRQQMGGGDRFVD